MKSIIKSLFVCIAVACISFGILCIPCRRTTPFVAFGAYSPSWAYKEENYLSIQFNVDEFHSYRYVDLVLRDGKTSTHIVVTTPVSPTGRYYLLLRNLDCELNDPQLPCTEVQFGSDKIFSSAMLTLSELNGASLLHVPQHFSPITIIGANHYVENFSSPPTVTMMNIHRLIRTRIELHFRE
jgi:hypothetical protein